MSPRARDMKERINKWGLINIKSFCTSKEKSIKLEKEPTIWENIFANDTSDKGLNSKIYKELIRLHSKKTSNPIKNWAKDLNRHFSKEDIQRVQKHMKRCSASEENQDGGVGRHTAPPRTTRPDRESNSKGDQHQGNRK